STKSMRKKWWLRSVLALGVLVIGGGSLLAADSSVRARHGESSTGLAADTMAKYLAGLAFRATPVAAMRGESPWIIHSTEMDLAWKRTEQQQLPAIANWAPDFLGAAH